MWSYLPSQSYYQAGPTNKVVSLLRWSYYNVFLLPIWSYIQGALIINQASLITKCGLIFKVFILSMWFYQQCDLIFSVIFTLVVLLPKWSLNQGGLITKVVLFTRWTHYQGGLITKVVLCSMWSITSVVLFIKLVVLPRRSQC